MKLSPFIHQQHLMFRAVSTLSNELHKVSSQCVKDEALRCTVNRWDIYFELRNERT